VTKIAEDDGGEIIVLYGNYDSMNATGYRRPTSKALPAAVMLAKRARFIDRSAPTRPGAQVQSASRRSTRSKRSNAEKTQVVKFEFRVPRVPASRSR